MDAWWIVETTGSARFPFRLRVEQEGRIVLSVRAQSEWPGAGGQVFCLREREVEAGEQFSPHERVPVASIARVGRRLLLVLDRGMRKRCEFLIVPKQRKDGTPFEQIFFRTEQAVRAHRTSGRVELRPHTGLLIAIDSAERYPWRFPGARTLRRKLAVGDYALLQDERPAAVLERKTLPNFLSDVGQIRGLHQQLADLAGHRHSAMLVEAQYGDLGRPDRIGRWPPAHLLRVVAELGALHPDVPIVFAGNRKLANVWAQQWFAAVAAAQAVTPVQGVQEELTLFHAAAGAGRLDTRVRQAVLQDMEPVFSFVALRARFADVPDARLRRILHALRSEGRVRCEGRGRSARWHRVGTDGVTGVP